MKRGMKQRSFEHRVSEMGLGGGQFCHNDNYFIYQVEWWFSYMEESDIRNLQDATKKNGMEFMLFVSNGRLNVQISLRRN